MKGKEAGVDKLSHNRYPGIRTGISGVMSLEVVKEFEKHAELLKALAHPVRLCIVRGLMENECNVTRIQNCLNLPQSTVSQQLGVLKNKGIIRGQRKGLEICYSVVDEEAKAIVRLLCNGD
jgi:predicted transcriptional regulator